MTIQEPRVESSPSPPDAEEAPSRDEELETIELGMLTEAVWRRYGLDFRNYAAPSLRRRIRLAMAEEGAPTVTALLDKLLHDPPAMERLLLRLSINVTAMFRDPGFFAALKRVVVPHLRSYPFVRIWHAGCSTGEEVYSMAVLLTARARCRITTPPTTATRSSARRCARTSSSRSTTSSPTAASTSST
jgi:chemotaxis protein methyltransferase CheR